MIEKKRKKSIAPSAPPVRSSGPVPRDAPVSGQRNRLPESPDDPLGGTSQLRRRFAIEVEKEVRRAAAEIERTKRPDLRREPGDSEDRADQARRGSRGELEGGSVARRTDVRVDIVDGPLPRSPASSRERSLARDTLPPPTKPRRKTQDRDAKDRTTKDRATKDRATKDRDTKDGIPTPKPRVAMGCIPRRLMNERELLALPLDHRAGFVLAHIDGKTNIRTLVDVCSMTPEEIHTTVERLAELGAIRLV